MLMLHAQDLLDQRIIESKKFVPLYAHSSVNEAMIEIVNMVRLTSTQSHLEIEYIQNRFPELRFDKRRLQQVLLNLLSNAIKSQSKGVITVLPRIKREDEQLFLEVSVEDQGLGLTQEEIKCIFEPFGTFKNRNNRTHQSNGVGLSICKQICE